MNFFEFHLRFPAQKKAPWFAFSGDPEAFRSSAMERAVSRYPINSIDVERLSTKKTALVIAALEQQPIGPRKILIAGDFQYWDLKSLSAWLEIYKPLNRVIVFWSSARSPKTDNDFAQFFIRRGWWVVVRRPDAQKFEEFLVSTYKCPSLLAGDLSALSSLDLRRAGTMATKVAFLGGWSKKNLDTAAVGLVSSVFVSVEQVLEGRPGLALQYVGPKISIGYLSLLGKAYRDILTAKLLSGTGITPAELANRTSIPLFLIPRTLAKGERFTIDSLIGILRDIAQAEIDIIQGAKDDLIIRALILKLGTHHAR